MSEQPKFYWFLVAKEQVTDYYDDYRIEATAAFIETSDCVWQLTMDDARAYNNMFCETGQKLRFIHIEPHDPLSVSRLQEEFAVYQAKKLAELEARKEAARKAAETRKANKAKREAERLAKDAEMERQIYEQLKHKFGDDK